MFEGLRHHAGKYYGKHSGTVVANDQDADNLGNITVSVPSIFGAGAAVQARPCMPYGHFFIPDVGVMVWVEFEAGNIDYPIWVGTWPQQGAVPPVAAISPPDNRVIQTASGHTIEIMDKAGEEKITIRHKGNAFVSIDKNGSVLIANQTGSYVELDADKGSATFVEQHGNILTMSADGIVVTEKDGKAMLQMTGDTVRVTGSSIILQAPSISLTGDSTPEPTFLATTFASAVWAPLLTWLGTHMHSTALGPSGPPLVPPASLIMVPGAPYISAGVVLK